MLRALNDAGMQIGILTKVIEAMMKMKVDIFCPTVDLEGSTAAWIRKKPRGKTPLPLDQLLWRKGLRDLWSRNDSAGVVAQLADGEAVQRMKRMEMQNEANILQKAEVVAWMTSKLDAVAGEKVEELKQKRTPILLEMLDAAMARAESLGAAGTQVKVVEKLARTVKYSVHEVSAALESVRAGESDGVFQVVFAYVAFIVEDAAKEVAVGKGDQVAKEALQKLILNALHTEEKRGHEYLRQDRGRTDMIAKLKCFFESGSKVLLEGSCSELSGKALSPLMRAMKRVVEEAIDVSVKFLGGLVEAVSTFGAAQEVTALFMTIEPKAMTMSTRLDKALQQQVEFFEEIRSIVLEMKKPSKPELLVESATLTLIHETERLLKKYSEEVTEWKRLFYGLAGLGEATERAVNGLLTRDPRDQVVVGFIEEAVAGAMTFLGAGSEMDGGHLFAPLRKHQQVLLAVVKLCSEGTKALIMQQADEALLHNTELWGDRKKDVFLPAKATEVEWLAPLSSSERADLSFVQNLTKLFHEDMAGNTKKFNAKQKVNDARLHVAAFAICGLPKLMRKKSKRGEHRMYLMADEDTEDKAKAARKAVAQLTELAPPKRGLASDALDGETFDLAEGANAFFAEIQSALVEQYTAIVTTLTEQIEDTVPKYDGTKRKVHKANRLGATSLSDPCARIRKTRTQSVNTRTDVGKGSWRRH